jgi:hypothetical protein
MIQEKFQLKEQASKVTGEIGQQTVTYITGGLGLVAGLAWNEAIKAIIDYWFPLSKDSVLAKLIYAVIITAVVVLITVYLLRRFKKEETEK